MKKLNEVKPKQGKLIVIDGGDGSGKATQAKLLIQFLRKNKVPVMLMDFPRYDQFFGKIVGRFLAGEFGDLKSVSPYLASITYALDRFSAKPKMNAWLDRGGFIVCNRYISSNLAHQSSRLESDKRTEFIRFITEMEYKKFGMPREDIVFYLQVPPILSQTLITLKKQRIYIKGKTDIAESSSDHQMQAADMYLRLAKTHKHWRIIKCTDESGQMLPIASIHEIIVQSLCRQIPKLCQTQTLKNPKS